MISKPFKFGLYTVMTVFFFISITSCSNSGPKRKPFTYDFLAETGLKEKNIKYVQFFLDRDIVLYRVLKNGDTHIKDGKVIQKGDKTIEEIVLRRGTPGVVVFMPKSDRLGVCFDPNDNNKYLMFGPSPKNKNRYSLLAEEWDRESGTVTYGSSRWKTPVSSAYATILVEYRNLNRTKHRTVSPEGRTIQD